MLYIDDERLPENFRNDNGLSLCKLWLLTYYGKQLTEDLIKNTEEEFEKTLSMTTISAYKFERNTPEIMLIGDKYYIGDGVNSVIYSPHRICEDLQEYRDGRKFIKSKYSIKQL